ncbi:PAS domain S-box protein [Maribacter sp. 2210JD10-5]|uniref:PAS domain S-box protein n=1 Tax=Maribacter sp. 2210JD10-5 TaxID=3386272 RepID=UPI0039BC7B16
METLSTNFLIKDSPAAVAILDTQLRFNSHSDEWYNRYATNKNSLIGKKFSVIFEETPTELKNALHEALNGNTQLNPGSKCFLPSGRTKWFKWKIKAWKNQDNTIGGVIVILDDITSEQREKELLLKAEAVARIGGWEVDLTNNSVYWSSITHDIHEVPEGFTPDLEKGIDYYKEGEHREKITELVSLAMTEGKPWDTELIITTHKGNEVWVRTKGEAEIIDGNCVRLFGTFQDINEKKKSELKYQETAERLKVATVAANIGIWEYDISNNSLIWDDNMYRLYGIDKKDFSGVYEAWQAGVHPEDKERGNLEIEQAISGEKEFDTEFRVLWPNGEVKNIKAIAKTERDSKGNAIKMVGTNWDITELKQTKLKLERSKESFKNTFNNSAIGMALVGLDGRWVEVNKGLCDSLGYTEEELLELTFQDITYPEDLDTDLGLFNEVIEGKRDSYQLEKRYYHKSGRTVFVVLTVTVVRTIEGKISHFISQIMDITPRKIAELKLEETAKRLKVAARVAKIGIWDYRIEENMVICNDNMYEMYGIPKDSSDLLNEWMNRIHPEDKERVGEELQMTILKGKPFNTQFRGIRPNGTMIHLIAFGEAQKGPSGKVENIIGANWDITKLKQTRLKLERSKESFTETFKNSVAGMALVGLDGKWISVNEGLCESFGYTEEEFLKITWQEITHPDDLDADMELLQQVLDGKISTYQFEKRFYHKNGRLIHTILTVTAAKDLNGKLSHLISQVLDITSRIEAEKKSQTLIEITKGQNDSLLNFAHIVSHNLRSHSSNLSMLSKFLDQEKDENERKNLNGMLTNATESLSETIAHLNEVVQVKTGALEKMESVGVLNTITQIEKSIEGLILEKGLTSEINVAKSHFVMAVPAYLESIFLNLYTNAIKYSAQERKPVIEITSTVKNGYVQIEFKDNGQGIDLKRHGKTIFGMYKTFHKHKDAKGIGLFITKNQIESMNGSISVTSEVDKGATFCINLKQG